MTLHIIARMGGEHFAFPAAEIEEAVDAPAVEWVPVAPEGMLGQLAHRGRMVGAWDAGWLFRLAAPAAGGAALLVRDGERRFAVVVDDVTEMVRIDPAQVRATPPGADTDGVLRGIWFRARRRVGRAGTPLVNVVRVEALAARASRSGTLVDGVTP
ncbi:MAG: chemotaxis protein CheW [Gemmatimonadaceae bacterium]